MMRLGLLRMLMLGLGASLPLEAADHHGVRFLGWDDFAKWRRVVSRGEATRSVEMSVSVAPGMAWTELVASWNLEARRETGLRVEVRPAGSARFYNMGRWAAFPGEKDFVRESVKGQADGEGDVDTDILVLKRQAEAFEVRLTLEWKQGDEPRLKFFGVVLRDSQLPAERLEPAPKRLAWGKRLPVPERSQVSYPGGEQSWCSPTAVSMILTYWSRELGKPEWDQDVPAVVEGVFDPQWPGTGNWAFNTAYAGSFEGLRAYVTRLVDVAELEAWVNAGVPVAVSVCYDRLRGRAESRGSGHLVVCVGFTENGDVVLNDPGTRENVQKVFPRFNLLRAWEHSHGTVYLIYPTSWATPVDRSGHWFEGVGKR